jgi:aerobic C4-dicarboxylate transport protein
MKSQPAAGRGKPKKLYQQLYVQVLFGVCLGIFVGHFWPEFGAAMRPFGDLFVKLVKMMIPPVVFCTIASGIYSMADNKQIGKTLLKAMGLFYALTVIALITGLLAVYALRPGVGLNIDPASIDPAIAAQYTKQVKSMGFVEFIIHIVPNTFFAAFTDGEVLPVLLLAILVGFGLTRVGAAGDPVKKAIDSFSTVLFAIFNFLMKLAPLGAFGGMAFTVGRYGIKSIGSLGMLIITFYVACGIFVFVVLNLLARMHGFSLMKLLRFTKEELLIVLGTSSTEPVLPRLLYKLERLGCKRGIVGLVLPAGYSFNLDGTAIYLTLASVFITQAMNIDLSWGQVLGMLLVMLLTSKGAAGVTGSGFVALVATLTIFPQVPVAGVAIIVGVDRFMSEARALTSMISNSVAVIVVSIWEHACNREVLQRELDKDYAATEDALEDPQVSDAQLTTGRAVAG